MFFKKEFFVTLACGLLVTLSVFGDSENRDTNPWPWLVPCGLEARNVEGVWRVEIPNKKKKKEVLYFEFRKRINPVPLLGLNKFSSSPMDVYQFNKQGTLIAQGVLRTGEPQEALRVFMEYKVLFGRPLFSKGYLMELGNFAELSEGGLPLGKSVCSPHHPGVMSIQLDSYDRIKLYRLVKVDQ